MSNPGVIRWGMCSAGLLSHDFTAGLKLLPESEHQITAVAARDLDRAQEFASRFDIPQAYGSYEELSKDPNVGKPIEYYQELMTEECLTKVRSSYTSFIMIVLAASKNIHSL